MTIKYSRQIAFAIFMLINFCFNLISVEKKDNNLLFKNLLIGALTGISEVSVNHPLVTLKNAYQQNKQIPLNSKLLSNLYKGYTGYALSMAPTTAVQIATDDLVKNYLSNKGQNNLSDIEKTIAAFSAGSLSAIVSCPSELILIKQQPRLLLTGFDSGALIIKELPGLSFKEAINDIYKQNKLKSFYIGFIPTAIRDGLFTVGYLVLADLIKPEISKIIDNETMLENEAIATISSNILAGVIAGIATHPSDTIKTNMQANNLKLYSSILEIYKENKLRAFYKGLLPRTARIMFAIPLMRSVSSRLKNYLDNEQV